jgi:hypothetical protein
VSLEQKHHVSIFEEARQGALLKLITALLLAMMSSINNIFKCTDALEVMEQAYLYEEIYCLLKVEKLALVF